MSAALDLLEGFWTIQTPVSFLAGIGVYHIYCRFKQKVADVREE